MLYSVSQWERGHDVLIISMRYPVSLRRLNTWSSVGGHLGRIRKCVTRGGFKVSKGHPRTFLLSVCELEFELSAAAPAPASCHAITMTVISTRTGDPIKCFLHEWMTSDLPNLRLIPWAGTNPSHYYDGVL